MHGVGKNGRRRYTARLYGAAAGVLTLLLPAVAGAQSAVSKVNGKVSGSTGSIDGDGAALFQGTLSMPLAPGFGGKVDGLIGPSDDGTIFGGALHLFWRNPEVGLIGVFGSHLENDDASADRVGLRGQYYLGQFTLRGAFGYQFSDDDDGDDDDGILTELDLRFYPGPDIVVGAGAETAGGQFQVNLTGEIMPDFLPPGLSLFVDGAAGEDDYEHILVGVRFYIGDDKDLIDRDREDVPADPLTGGLGTIARQPDRQNNNSSFGAIAASAAESPPGFRVEW
jgi:hypothetical protein